MTKKVKDDFDQIVHINILSRKEIVQNTVMFKKTVSQK